MGIDSAPRRAESGLPERTANHHSLGELTSRQQTRSASAATTGSEAGMRPRAGLPSKSTAVETRQDPRAKQPTPSAGTMDAAAKLTGKQPIGGPTWQSRGLNDGASASSGHSTVKVYRVDDNSFPPRITVPDGSVPEVLSRKGKERPLFVNFGQPERAKHFALGNRNGNALVTSVDVDSALLEKLRAESIYDKDPDIKAHPNAPLVVDINHAPDQYGLRTSEQIQWLRDSIVSGSARIEDPNGL